MKGSFDGTQRLQLYWDSTTLRAFRTCPKLYEIQYVRDLSPKAKKADLVFGTHLHAALAEYDIRRALGAGHDDAQANMVVELNSLLISEPIPDHKIKTPENLLRACVWYTEHFQDDPLRTHVLSNGKPALELSFKVPSGIYAPDGTEYYLCGHLDKIVEWDDQLWVLDRKTTKSDLNDHYFSGYTPDTQVSLYSFAARVAFDLPIAGLIIDGIQLLSAAARFHRRPINRTEDYLEEWLADLTYDLDRAATYAAAGRWPRNDTACGNYGKCIMRDYCTASPKARDLYLSEFEPRTWDPTVAR